MARFTAAALALAFFTGSASADCFDKCNQTYVSC